MCIEDKPCDAVIEQAIVLYEAGYRKVASEESLAEAKNMLTNKEIPEWLKVILLIFGVDLAEAVNNERDND